MIRIVEDNIIKAPEEIIVQQVNCQGAMNSGVAKAIREKYSEVYDRYMHYCNTHISLGRAPHQLLGESFSVITNDRSKDIVCIFGQDNYGYDGRRYTNYNALFRGLCTVFTQARTNVAIPFKIGCDRGGGDWDNVVYPFLQTCSCDFGYDIVLYKYNK